VCVCVCVVNLQENFNIKYCVNSEGEEMVDSVKQRSGTVLACLFNNLTQNIIDYIGETLVNDP
jgi:hypothetical protein